MGCLARYESVDIDVRYDGHGDHVVLRLHNHQTPDDYVEAVFNRFNLPALFDGILKATRTEQPRAIGADHLGGLVVPEGHSTSRLPDGNVELTVNLRTDEGMRAVSWPMSADAAQELASDLIRYSS